jgi:hypothetical protein
MADTGIIAPTAAVTATEDPWLDNDWVSPANIYGAGEAAITASQFDSPNQSYVLKAYGFDFSAIPDGSTIDGVQVVINARYAVAAVSLDLCQLLDTSRAKVGTNKYATPQALTTSAANYTIGGAADKWGNELDAVWVKDPDFGVAIGAVAGGSNSDVFIDSVTMQVWYTEGITDRSVSESEEVAVTESTVVQFNELVASVSDSIANQESITAERVVYPLSVSVADAVADTDAKIISLRHSNFAAIREYLVAALDSAQSEGTGWDAVVKAALLADLSKVVRTSDTVVTITLPACASYDITAQETITGTVPWTCLVSSTTDLVGSPQFTVDPVVAALAVDKSDVVSAAELTAESLDKLVASIFDTVAIEETPSVEAGASAALSASASDTISIAEHVPTWSEWSEVWEITTAEPERAWIADSVTVERVELDTDVSESDQAAISEYAAAALDKINVSLVDSLSIAEAVSRSIVEVSDRDLSVVDAASVSEAVAAGLNLLNVSQVDSASVADVTAVQFDTLLVSGYDSAAVAESVAARLDKILLSLSDAVATVEGIAASVGELGLAKQDQSAVSDSVAASLNLLAVSEADQSEISESISVRLDKLIINLSDSLDTIEVVSRSIEDQATRLVSESDAATISDSVSIRMDRMVSEAEQAVVTEAISASLDKLLVSVADVAAAAEQVSIYVGIVKEVSRSDAVALAESVSASLNVLNVSVADSVSPSDPSAAMLERLDALEEEAASVSDAAYAALDLLQLDLSDAVAITEAVAGDTNYTRLDVSTADSVSVTDNPLPQAGHAPHGAGGRGSNQGKSHWRTSTSQPRNRYRG